jgi:hypothetical protein
MPALPRRQPGPTGGRDPSTDAWWNYYAARTAWMVTVWDAVTASGPEDSQIAMQARHWHALVLERLVKGRVGAIITVQDIANVAADASGSAAVSIYRAADAFASVLLRLGYLAHAANGGYRIVADCEPGGTTGGARRDEW